MCSILRCASKHHISEVDARTLATVHSDESLSMDTRVEVSRTSGKIGTGWGRGPVGKGKS